MILYTFHYSDGVMFGIGTMREFEQHKAEGTFPADSHTEVFL